MSALRTILAGLFLLGLAGCWDVRDINDRTPALALGVDHDRGVWRISVAEVLPKGGESASYASDFHTGEGASLSQAMDDVRSRAARRLYLGTARVVVFGEGALAYGVDPVFQDVLSHPEVAMTTFLVAATGRAEDLLKQTDPALGSSAVRLDRQMTHQESLRDGHLPMVLWRALSLMRGPGRAFYLPLFGPTRPEGLRTLGTAVVGGDGRLVLTLSPQRTQALRWLLGVPGRNLVSLPDGTEVKTTWTRSDLDVLSGRLPRLTLRLSTKVELYNRPAFTLTDARVEAVEAMTASLVRDRAIDLLRVLRAHGADLVRFGEVLQQHGLDPSLSSTLPVVVSSSVRLDPKESLTP